MTDFNRPTTNLLPPEQQRPPKATPHPRMRFLSFCLIIIIVTLLLMTGVIARGTNRFFVGVKNGFLMRQLTHIFMGGANELKGQASDRINFLLMGIGGPGHEGPYLTDTIILASYKPSTNEVALLSIPRDLIVPTGNGNYQKINSVYALDQKNGVANAFIKTKDVIGRTFGVDINYMGVVDFTGFTKMINAVGGVDVVVDKAFTDNDFPFAENKIRSISFKEGKQHMDGATALQFARSRHGNNGEGSDFARGKRQQKIILATKEKVSSFNTLFNPVKITALFNLVTEYTKTDMEPWEAVQLIQMARSTKSEHIYSFALDDTPGGYLYGGTSSIDGAYILQPRDGTYAEVKNLVTTIFDSGTVRQEQAKVALQNGTKTPNLATTIGGTLQKFGIPPVGYGNAGHPSPLTIIYDYTNGGKPATQALLESFFKTHATSKIPIDNLAYTVARTMNVKNQKGVYETLDFLVVLGEDIAKAQVNGLIRLLQPGERASTTPTSTPPLPL